MKKLDLHELSSLVEELVEERNTTRVVVGTVAAEVSRRLKASADELEISTLTKLETELADWLIRDARILRNPRGGRGGGICMCSVNVEH